MRSGQVGLFEAEEEVIVQVGIALGVDEERVADAAPVDGEPLPVWSDREDRLPRLDGSEPVDGSLDELDLQILEQALVYEGEDLLFATLV
jgi:hypothetical protein